MSDVIVVTGKIDETTTFESGDFRNEEIFARVD